MWGSWKTQAPGGQQPLGPPDERPVLGVPPGVLAILADQPLGRGLVEDAEEREGGHRSRDEAGQRPRGGPRVREQRGQEEPAGQQAEEGDEHRRCGSHARISGDTSTARSEPRPPIGPSRTAPRLSAARRRASLSGASRSRPAALAIETPSRTRKPRLPRSPACARYSRSRAGNPTWRCREARAQRNGASGWSGNRVTRSGGSSGRTDRCRQDELVPELRVPAVLRASSGQARREADCGAEAAEERDGHRASGAVAGGGPGASRGRRPQQQAGEEAVVEVAQPLRGAAEEHAWPQRSPRQPPGRPSAVRTRTGRGAGRSGRRARCGRRCGRTR